MVLHTHTHMHTHTHTLTQIMIAGSRLKLSKMIYLCRQ